METYRQKTSCMACHLQAKHCHFVFFLEMRVLPPDESQKDLERVFTTLDRFDRQRDK
jgi:hypothetical protein